MKYMSLLHKPLLGTKSRNNVKKGLQLPIDNYKVVHYNVRVAD